MEKETAGDPVSGCRWTRKTTEKIAEQLKKLHIEVSANTVSTAARLLKNMNYHLRVNLKCIESGLKNPPDPYVRNLQYQYVVKQWNDFACAGLLHHSPKLIGLCSLKVITIQNNKSGLNWLKKWKYFHICFIWFLGSSSIVLLCLGPGQG